MINRRSFIEIGMKGIAALSLYFLPGCSPKPTPKIETSSYIYPQLKKGKIKPPEKGCWVGFHPFNPGYPESYLTRMGKHPKLFVPRWMHTATSNTFIKDSVEDIADTGSIPIVYWDISSSFIYGNFDELPSSKQFREDIKKYARDIVKCNKKIFFSTMKEMNHSVWDWGQKPETFKKIWRLMHKIFREEGANELTTWFWEIYCPRPGAERTDSPVWYWPGDEYVDYIGLSAFSRDGYETGNESLYSLVSSTIHNLHKHYTDKPIMITEFGKTKSSSQAYWIEDAFRYIKQEPLIKGVVYWDSALIMGNMKDDHTLHSSSFKYLKNLFKEDPYFIFADYQKEDV